MQPAGALGWPVAVDRPAVNQGHGHGAEMAAVRTVPGVVTFEPNIRVAYVHRPLDYGPVRVAGVIGGDDVARLHRSRLPDQQPVTGLERRLHARAGDNDAPEVTSAPPHGRGSACGQAHSEGAGAHDWATRPVGAIA
jgi:hypothetical protein